MKYDSERSKVGECNRSRGWDLLLVGGNKQGVQHYIKKAKVLPSVEAVQDFELLVS